MNVPTLQPVVAGTVGELFSRDLFAVDGAFHAGLFPIAVAIWPLTCEPPPSNDWIVALFESGSRGAKNRSAETPIARLIGGMATGLRARPGVAAP